MYKVIDTNIILLDAHNLTSLASDGSTIVLPETVLDEIDSKKSGLNELAFQAREFGRLLSKATKVRTDLINDLNVTVLIHNDIEIHVVSSTTYPDFKDSASSIINDRKIIEIAVQYNNVYPDDAVVFISNDVMCRLRADSLGLTTSDLKEVEDKELLFTTEVTLDDVDVISLHSNPVSTVIPNLPIETSGLKITNATTGQVHLAYVVADKCVFIDRELEDTLRKQELPPINSDQLLFSSMIQSKDIDIVICDSKAGSGKSAVAISNAAKLVGSNSPYKTLIYIRNTVDDVSNKDEEIGFLSGNEEKIKGYLEPFYDTITAIAENKLKSSKLKGEQYTEKLEDTKTTIISKYNMQATTALYMRGRTFNDAVVILDEAQNMSKATMLKLLTRLGKNIKLVVIGSLRQIDSAYINRHTSGLAYLLNACKLPADKVNVVGTALPRVVRGPITEWAEQVLT
jgi:PhoH-like ATPase